jgi:hypothetical protein
MWRLLAFDAQRAARAIFHKSSSLTGSSVNERIARRLFIES